MRADSQYTLQKAETGVISARGNGQEGKQRGFPQVELKEKNCKEKGEIKKKRGSGAWRNSGDAIVKWREKGNKRREERGR